MITELKKGVYWVGAVDWDLRSFHGHELSTHRGSSYNAYLIVDEKIVLVDTVWAPFKDKLIEHISEIIDPSKIDIVVSNHAETDHSGALPEIMSYAPNAQLIVSRKGAESIEGYYHKSWNYTVVKTGDRINIGQNELVFIEASMIHWPDSMFTYLTGHNILMSNDAFGQHYATEYRFNNQVNNEELYDEAIKYYANIITPFSKLAARKIDEILAMNLPIDIIAPSHGVIWRDNPIQIVEKYIEWTKQAPEKKALILFDTMWDATRKMAEAISDGLTSEGVGNKLINVAITDRNDIVTEIFKAKAIIIGSPTVNNGYLATMAPIMEDIRGMKFQNKIGAAFGSYGWSGESVKLIEEHLEKSGIAKAADGYRAKWQPTPADLEKCRELGKSMASAVKAD